MKLIAKTAIALSLCAMVSCAKPQEKEVMPILAWCGIPSEYISLERFQELADCGFNMNLAWMNDLETLKKALDYGEQTGVKIMAECGELYSKTDSAVNEIKDHPALYGYFLRDEPLPPAFPELADWAQRIKDADNTHALYLNLFPSYVSEEAFGCTYREYTRRFIEEVKLPMVSFDNYPIVFDGIRQLWYENLEIISDESAKAGLPFWAFTLSVPHGSYPMPTLASMRIQLYTDLAYGAQGLQYFTYWTPYDPYWGYHCGPISHEGEKTEVYPIVKQLNAEIQARAGIFVNSKVLAVRQTGERIPPHTTPLTELPAHVTALETVTLGALSSEAADDPVAVTAENSDPVKAAGEAAPFMPTWDSDGAVVSVLEKGKYQYLMVVNRSVTRPVELSVAFDEKVCMMDRRGEPVKVSKALSTYTIEEGDCAIFRYKK